VSLIPLGVLAASGAAGPIGAYELIESVVLTGTQATIEFSNLNSTYGSTYKHLQVRWAARTDRGLANDPLRYYYNGSQAANTYADHSFFTNGTTSSTENTANGSYITMHSGLPASSATANIFGIGYLDILEPFNTNRNKTSRGLHTGMADATAYQIRSHSGLWMNTTAISSITFDPIGSFVSGTRFSLYGMRSS
jgi:hypothetical protein